MIDRTHGSGPLYRIAIAFCILARFPWRGEVEGLSLRPDGRRHQHLKEEIDRPGSFLALCERLYLGELPPGLKTNPRPKLTSPRPKLTKPRPKWTNPRPKLTNPRQKLSARPGPFSQLLRRKPGLQHGLSAKHRREHGRKHLRKQWLPHALRPGQPLSAPWRRRDACTPDEGGNQWSSEAIRGH